MTRALLVYTKKKRKYAVEKPITTLSSARKEAKTIKKQKGVTRVWIERIRPGEYKRRNQK